MFISYPGTSRLLRPSIPLDDPPPLDSHFQGFLRDCWHGQELDDEGISGHPNRLAIRDG